MRHLTGYLKPVVALAVTPDGTRLFTAADGQTTVWEWDLAAGTVTQKLKWGTALALAASPAGDFLVRASFSRIGYWPLAGGGEEPREIDVRGSGRASLGD